MNQQSNYRGLRPNHGYPRDKGSPEASQDKLQNAALNTAGKVLVVGSLNMDYVLTTERLPLKGETLPARDFLKVHGGKGMNQAVALSRLSEGQIIPTMIGCLGRDRDGEELLRGLEEASIATESIQRREDIKTGIAFITVSDTGDNTIVVHPGSNHGLTSQWVLDAIHKHRNASMLVLQMEIPLEIITKTIDIAYDYGIPVVLNPSPFKALPKETLEKVHTLVVNQVEAEQVATSIKALPEDATAEDNPPQSKVSKGSLQRAQQRTEQDPETPRKPPAEVAEEKTLFHAPDPKNLVVALAQTKIPQIILTLGDQGVYYNVGAGFLGTADSHGPEEPAVAGQDSANGSPGAFEERRTDGGEEDRTTVQHQRAIKVPVVDPTAAGDSFLGAYVAGRSLGYSLEQAINYGIYAGALAVTKSGAQPSIPTKQDLLNAGWRE